MWTRKELKKVARRNIKTHYWKMLVICLILAYFVEEYNFAGTTNLIEAYDEVEAEASIETNFQDGKGGMEILSDLKDGMENQEPEIDSAKDIEDAIKGGGDNTNIVNRILGGSGKSENGKYNRGILSVFFNNITASSSVTFGTLNAINEMIFKDRIMFGIVLILGNLLAFLAWFFIKNPLKVCEKRFFLEAHTYEKVSMDRLLFVFQIRKLWNVAKIMFAKVLFTGLWALTIVGGFVKHYSYYMIPYIVAENPNISRSEAFTLSISMMKGNKWKAFLLDMSFAGWNLLSYITGGLAGIFYSNPYLSATRAEFYFQLRHEAIKREVNYCECFNDAYLLQKPTNASEEVLSYPMELFSIAPYERRKTIKHDYRRHYTVWSLVLLFFTFSVIGWLWEVSLHLSTDGFVNRGVQHGPWLPIYGSGGVLILVLLQKVREHPIVTFFLTVCVCGVLEYSTSYYLEMTHNGTKWWDYSGYFLNINGRVCAEGLLVFGLGGCAIIYFAAPLFDDLYKKIPHKIQIMLCIILLGTFGTDVAYSHKHPNKGKGITNYKTHIEEPYNIAKKG